MICREKYRTAERKKRAWLNYVNSKMKTPVKIKMALKTHEKYDK